MDEKQEKLPICRLCKTKAPRKDSTTRGMTVHLKQYHGFGSKTNAWKVLEELSSLKDECLKRKRKPEETSESESKQAKISDFL